MCIWRFHMKFKILKQFFRGLYNEWQYITNIWYLIAHVTVDVSHYVNSHQKLDYISSNTLPKPTLSVDLNSILLIAWHLTQQWAPWPQRVNTRAFNWDTSQIIKQTITLRKECQYDIGSLLSINDSVDYEKYKETFPGVGISFKCQFVD